MRKVKYEELLPHEFEEALRQFPVAYVPVGSLEWHGRHLALGNDTLKAYGILLRTAELHGGIVVPPTYWGHMGYWKPGCHPGLMPEIVDGLYSAIFRGLVTVGFKVVIGVTGHDVKEMLASLQQAVASISADGAAAGFAMMEGDLYDLAGDEMDHAAHWETSILMVLRPDLVDMDRIRNEVLTTEAGAKEAGIWGRDPRTDASRELGEKIVSRIADNIGKKAQELLAGLRKQRAEIFRRYGPAYRARFGPQMLPGHHEAMRAIEQCRTPALGGQVYECRDCGEFRYLYHSCRNRHCPKCQNGNAQEWLAALGRALPVGRQWPQRPKYLAPSIFRVAISRPSARSASVPGAGSVLLMFLGPPNKSLNRTD